MDNTGSTVFTTVTPEPARLLLNASTRARISSPRARLLGLAFSTGITQTVRSGVCPAQQTARNRIQHAAQSRHIEDTSLESVLNYRRTAARCQTRTQSTSIDCGKTVESSGFPGQSPPTAT